MYQSGRPRGNVGPSNVYSGNTFVVRNMVSPSVFDIMTHLVIHLVGDLEICGQVHSRWMYGVEMYLGVLKGFVRNRARPEASMATGYAQNESLGFLTEHLLHFNHTSRRVWDTEEDEQEYGEFPQGALRLVHVIPEEEFQQLHEYVIMNYEDTLPSLRYSGCLRLLLFIIC